MSFFKNGKIISFLSLTCVALACFFALSLIAINSAQAADSENCLSCHSGSPAAAPNVSLFNVSGHGRAGIDCIECHVAINNHNDGGQTYAFDITQYGPSLSGVAYAAGYMLKDVGGEVPLMIPSSFGITFGYNGQTMKDTAFRLCFSCHDASKILDDTHGDGLNTNFKTSLPDPPFNYSFLPAGNNGHVIHIMNFAGWVNADSDWEIATTGPGAIPFGMDTQTTCTTCHNVHGADGAGGSTNEAMIRDGSLVGRSGYGFSYVVEDGSYPQVTSTGANQSNSVGAIFRNNTANNTMCYACHGGIPPQPDQSYDASGLNVEYYRSLTISSASYNTPVSEPGEPPVTVVDPVTDTQVIFSQVDVEGETSIETSLTNPVKSLNANFRVKGVYLDIHTSADISGNIEICLNYSTLGIKNANNLRLLHYEGGQWVTVTVPSEPGEGDNTICGTVDSLSWFVLVEQLIRIDMIRIDIKPGSDPNCFNQNQHGAIPVAIFGRAHLDVNDIIVDSLSLQGLEVKMAGKSNKYLAHYEDANEDNYLDLVIQFEDSDGWIDTGSGYATITGQLLDGTSFEGTDSICIVP